MLAISFLDEESELVLHGVDVVHQLVDILEVVALRFRVEIKLDVLDVLSWLQREQLH